MSEGQTAESRTGVVGLAGDWHGNLAWAREAIRSLAGAGIKRIYHLGDFGVWPGAQGQKYLNHVNATAKHYDIEIWVTPGNHEDYDQIAGVPAERDDGLQWIRSNIALIPRGHRWVDHERSFVSLGGAPSIDFEARTVGVSWWPAERIEYGEVMCVIADGYADVMLAHDAPDGGTAAVQSIIDTPADKSPWSAKGLAYATEGRQLMNEAVAGVEPILFAHGHYHAPDDTGPQEPTRYLSLGCDNQPQNVCLLRLDDLAVSWDGHQWSPTDATPTPPVASPEATS